MKGIATYVGLDAHEDSIEMAAAAAGRHGRRIVQVRELAAGSVRETQANRWIGEAFAGRAGGKDACVLV